MKKLRKPLVVANWKMNILPSKACQLAEEIKNRTNNTGIDIVIAPPYTHLALMSHLSSADFSLGAQNVHSEVSGAFTGSISVDMLKDLQVQYVILGHSERRESNINENIFLEKKIDNCLRGKLNIIYCCGESLEVRQRNEEKEFVISQLEDSFSKLKVWSPQQIVIAYEPIWAIGTGLTASAEQADVIHLCIRNWIADQFGDQSAHQTRILYGGSVKSSNAHELASKENIDGFLVGGASLNVEEFSVIAHAFNHII